MIVAILLTICMIGLILCGWALVANEIAYRQRIKKIPRPGDKDFWEKFKVYQSVSNDQHFWQVFTFRNADDLYKDKKNNV